MAGQAKIGLGLLPLEFLEAYPFPAFALHVPIPLDPNEELFAAIDVEARTPGEEVISAGVDVGNADTQKSISGKGQSPEGSTRGSLLTPADAFGTIPAPRGGPTLVGPSLRQSGAASTHGFSADVADDPGAPIPPKSTFLYNPFLRAGHNSSTLYSNLAQPVQLSDIPFRRHHAMGETASGLNAVWGNGKWQALMKGRKLLECISVVDARQLGNWVSGLTEWEIRRLAAAERRRRRREGGAQDGGIGSAHVKSPPISRGNSEESTGSSESRSSGSSGLDMSQSKTWQRRRERQETSGSGGTMGDQPWLNPERRASGSSESLRDLERERGSGGSGPTDEHEDEEPDDSRFLDDLLEQPTLTIHLADPGISLELVKTAYPLDPPDRHMSYLVIQAIPRRTQDLVRKVEPPLGPDIPDRVAIGNQQHKADGKSPRTSAQSRTDRAWPFNRSSTIVPGISIDEGLDGFVSPSTQLTPVAERTVPSFTPSTYVTAEKTTDHKAEVGDRQAMVHALFPTQEAMVIGAVDSDQFAGPRKISADPLAIEHLLNTIDWERHILGPMHLWPQSLKTAFSLILAIPGQAMIWWGKELCLLYNDHYARMVGGKHPGLFASAGATGYAEVWAALGPLAEQVLAGTALAKEDDPFLFETMDEDAPLIEHFHSWLWSPIRDETGSVGGLFNYTRETTKKVLAERRLRCMRETNDLLSASRNIKEFDQAVTEAFSDEEIAKDLPFSIIYHVTQPNSLDSSQACNLMDEKSGSSTRSSAVKLLLTRGGMVGVPEDHPSAPMQQEVTIRRQARSWGALDPNRVSSPTLSMISALSVPQEEDELRTDDADHWPFEDALQSKKAVIVGGISNLIAGYQVRSWDTLPHSAVVLPVFNDTSSEIPALVMVLGLNPRRPYDLDYSEWVHQLRLQLYNGLLQVRSVEASMQRTKELQEMDAIKTNWIASVSHELRLPLTLIGGPMDDIIAEMKESTRQKGALVMARRNVHRLQRLIDQLMDYSRLEAGKLTGCFRPTHLGAYTNDLAILFRSAIEKAKLDYVVECELDDDRVCYVDPDLYEKIVLNMIGNAYKYTHRGQIKVTLKYTESAIVLAVSDTGVGIPFAMLDRVTERFFRVPSSARSHEGSGIGLSLTKELIRLHGGTLAVTSVAETEAPGQLHGSTFTVTLPLGFAHLPAVEEADGTETEMGKYARGVIEEAMQWNREDAASTVGSESDSNPLTSSSDRSGGSLDPSTLFFTKEDTILIVDDSRDLRAYLTSTFAPYVGRVLQAGDGMQGLELAKIHRPQLIISDIQMPRMDGIQLLQAIKASEDDLRFTPVILLTARAGEGDRVEGLLTGAEDYLTKPFNSKELIARASLQVQLGKRRRILEDAFATRLEEVEKRREEAEAERRRQELLIDVTSHELRNPTSAIIQASSMVLQDLGTLRSALGLARQAGKPFNVTEEVLTELLTDEELCINIFNCANTQNTISSDILTLATISLDKLTFTEAPMDVRRKIQEVCSMFALEAKSKDIRLEVNCAANMTDVPLVVTDPARLGQVLVNLTANALKWTTDREIRRVSFDLALAATPPFDSSCAVPATATLPSDLKDDDVIYLYVAVTDTGPGLPHAELEKLFQRFSQAKQTGPNKIWGGSGLGLYVSRKIAEQMGGWIEVVSVLGEGATFRFFIKVRAAGVKPKNTPANPPPVARRRSSMDQEHRAHILVVEDNLINQKLILRQLRKAGLTCEAASNGLQAVQRIREVRSITNPIDKPFDTVLLDLEMPVMGGLEAIRIIRSEEEQGLLSRSTVFALTGNARQGQIDEAKAHGMDAVIIKPYRLDDVLDMIADAVHDNSVVALTQAVAMRKSATMPVSASRQ